MFSPGSFQNQTCILGCQQCLKRSRCLRSPPTIPAGTSSIAIQRVASLQAAVGRNPTSVRHQLSKKKKLVLLTSELSAELSSFGLKEALPMVHPKVGKDWRSLAHTGVWRDEPVLAAVCRCIHQAGLFSRQISTCLY